MNAALHRRLMPLISQDIALYLKSMKNEWLQHVAALKAAGWRKARAA
jgi:hypothetical protein